MSAVYVDGLLDNKAHIALNLTSRTKVVKTLCGCAFYMFGAYPIAEDEETGTLKPAVYRHTANEVCFECLVKYKAQA